MLVVDNVKHFISDNDAVTGSKSIFYPAGEVQTLLNEYHWIAAVFFGLFILLKYVAAVFLSAVLHFTVVVGKVSSWICDFFS